MLDHEEYVEQAYFFRTLGERMGQAGSTQELLRAIREEILATTKLPLALDFMAAELNLTGAFATAMAKLPHYFAAFQTYAIAEAENEQGRFDLRVALEILRREAEYRAEGATPQGLFLYQFECLCRNRLSYDKGLEAISADPIYNDDWRAWIQTVRRQVGIVDFADLLYVRSRYFAMKRQTGAGALRGGQRRGDETTVAEDDKDDAIARGTNSQDSESSEASGEEVAEKPKPILFGEKEGRIALANRRKDPLYLFSALQRQLGYPAVPRPKPVNDAPSVLASLSRQVQRLESRVKLLEEEERGGIDITKFYGPPTEKGMIEKGPMGKGTGP